jgi:hypothetical protein
VCVSTSPLVLFQVARRRRISLALSSTKRKALSPIGAEIPISASPNLLKQASYAAGMQGKSPGWAPSSSSKTKQADWACSVCPHCAQPHRETLFAYPPSPPLLNAFVAKARADGACAIAPLSAASPSWNKLLRASVIRNGKGYLRVRRQHPFPDADVAGELAIFAADFAANGTRSRTLPTSPSPSRAAGIPASVAGTLLAPPTTSRSERASMRSWWPLALPSGDDPLPHPPSLSLFTWCDFINPRPGQS